MILDEEKLIENQYSIVLEVSSKLDLNIHSRDTGTAIFFFIVYISYLKFRDRLKKIKM